MSETTETVWVTKYALTTGIEKVVAKIREPYAYYCVGTWCTQVLKKDWHRNLDDAKARVTEMIDAKRLSLDKSVKTLDKLRASLLNGSFKVVDRVEANP